MNLPLELQTLIREARVARLATVDARSRPHVVPVCFALHGQVAYVALDAKPKRVPVASLRRVRNLLANPEVQLLIDRYDEDWSRLAWVQFRGRASMIEPSVEPVTEHAEAVSLLRAKYPQYAAMALEDAPIIRVEVEDQVAWEAARP